MARETSTQVHCQLLHNNHASTQTHYNMPIATHYIHVYIHVVYIHIQCVTQIARKCCSNTMYLCIKITLCMICSC